MEVYQPDARVLEFLQKGLGRMSIDSKNWNGASVTLGVCWKGVLGECLEEDQRKLKDYAKQLDYLAITNLILDKQGKSPLELTKTPQAIKVKSNKQEIASFKVRHDKKTKDSAIIKVIAALILSEIAPIMFQELFGYAPHQTSYQTNDKDAGLSANQPDYLEQDLNENAELTTQDNMSELPTVVCQPAPQLAFFDHVEESRANQSWENPKRSSSGEHRTQMNRQAETSIVSTSLRTRSHSHDSRTMRIDRHGNLQDLNDGEEGAPEVSSEEQLPEFTTQQASYCSNIILTPEALKEVGIKAPDEVVLKPLEPLVFSPQNIQEQVGQLLPHTSNQLLLPQECTLDLPPKQELVAPASPKLQHTESEGSKVPYVDTPMPDLSGSALQSESRTQSDNSQQMTREERLPVNCPSLVELFVAEAISPFVGSDVSVPSPDFTSNKIAQRFDVSKHRRIIDNFKPSFFDDGFSKELGELFFKLELILTEVKYITKSQDSKYVIQELMVRCSQTKHIKLIHRLQVATSITPSLGSKVRRFHMVQIYYPDIASRIAHNSLSSCFKRVLASEPQQTQPISSFLSELASVEPPPLPAPSNRSISPKSGKISVAPALPASGTYSSPKKSAASDLAEPRTQITSTTSIKINGAVANPPTATAQTTSALHPPTEQTLLLDSTAVLKEGLGHSLWKQRASENTKVMDSLALSIIDKVGLEDSYHPTAQNRVRRWVLTVQDAEEHIKGVDLNSNPEKDKKMWPYAQYRTDRIEEFEKTYSKAVVSQRSLTVGNIFISQHYRELKVPASEENIRLKQLERTLSTCVATTLDRFFKEAFQFSMKVINISSSAIMVVTDTSKPLLRFRISEKEGLTGKCIFETAGLILMRTIFKSGHAFILERFPTFGS